MNWIVWDLYWERKEYLLWIMSTFLSTKLLVKLSDSNANIWKGTDSFISPQRWDWIDPVKRWVFQNQFDLFKDLCGTRHQLSKTVCSLHELLTFIKLSVNKNESGWYDMSEWRAFTNTMSQSSLFGISFINSVTNSPNSIFFKVMQLFFKEFNFLSPKKF